MRVLFSEDIARDGLKGATVDELTELLIDALIRADALEAAICDALEPGRYGWELLDADTMAECLAAAYDPFDQAEPQSASEQIAVEREKLVSWNKGEPIKGWPPAGYYTVNSRG